MTLFFFVSFAYADQLIFSGPVDEAGTFHVENIEHTIRIGTSLDKVSISNPFNLLIVSKGNCEQKGYYVYCVDGIEDEGVFPLHTKAKIRVSKRECIQYTSDNNESKCKLPIYGSCSENKECASLICSHGACTFRHPICGDGYCDEKENCVEDCQVNPTVISINPYKIQIPVDKGWISTLRRLEEGKKYLFTVNGDYTLDWTGKKYDQSSNQKNPSSPCPDVNFGAVVGRTCGKCFEISSNAVHTAENTCDLELMINEEVLIDNSGNLTITIEEQEIYVPPEPAIVTPTLEEPEEEEKEEPVNENVQESEGLDIPIAEEKDNEAKSQEQENESGISGFIWFLIICVFGFLAYKHKQVKKVIKDFFAAILQDFSKSDPEINKLLKEYQDSKVKREKLSAEFNEELEKIKQTKDKKSDAELKFNELVEEYNKKEEELNTKINEIERKIQGNSSLLAEKLRENLRLEKELELINKKNIELSKEKIKREVEIEEKKKAQQELKRKYQEEVRKAKQKYSGDELDRELQEIGKDFKESKETINKGIEKSIQKERELSKASQEVEKEKKKISEKEKDLDKIIIDDSEQLKLVKSKTLTPRIPPKNYKEFLENFSKNIKNCESYLDFVKEYIKIFRKDSENLKYLAKYLQEKEKTENYDFVYDIIKKFYNEEIKKLTPDLISDLKEIDSMSGDEFEEYLEVMFETIGYEATKTKRSRDGGVDLILKKDDKITLIQAKRYKITETISVDAVRAVFSKKDKYKAERLVVLTTAMKFSVDARKEAKEMGVELWGRDKFKELLKQSKLIKND